MTRPFAIDGPRRCDRHRSHARARQARPACVSSRDWGAKVIKIEMPEDGPSSTQTDFSARHEPDFQNLHRNKRGMTLNLKEC